MKRSQAMLFLHPIQVKLFLKCFCGLAVHLNIQLPPKAAAAMHLPPSPSQPCLVELNLRFGVSVSVHDSPLPTHHKRQVMMWSKARETQGYGTGISSARLYEEECGS